jgi:hypothetical protein
MTILLREKRRLDEGRLHLTPWAFEAGATFSYVIGSGRRRPGPGPGPQRHKLHLI